MLLGSGEKDKCELDLLAGRTHHVHHRGWTLEKTASGNLLNSYSVFQNVCIDKALF